MDCPGDTTYTSLKESDAAPRDFVDLSELRIIINRYLVDAIETESPDWFKQSILL
jgi:hypothetical protein